MVGTRGGTCGGQLGRDVRPPCQRCRAFFLGEATPDSVGFTRAEGMDAALREDWTVVTHAFGCGCPADPRAATLTFGMEERVWAQPAA